MDNYNVINLTSSLEDLENDMIAWMNLPLNFRLRADEECIRRYGMNNIDLYNSLKSSIISDKLPEDPQLIGAGISEGTIEVQQYSTEYEDYKWRLDLSNMLQQSASIIIINPNNYEEVTAEQLGQKYLNFMALNKSNKRLSNQYSLDIWGYDVPNMYQIVRNRLLSIKDTETIDYKIEANEINTVKREFATAYLENDHIKTTDISIKAGINSNNKLLNELSELTSDPEDYFAEFTPYFTPNEMSKYCTENIAATVDSIHYPSLVIKAMDQYNANPTEENKQYVLNCGWNPSVQINRNSVSVARERFINWYKSARPVIEDVTKLCDSSLVLNESSATMENIYAKKDIYPVFIVLSYSGTIFGKVIRAVKHCEYSHAGITLNSDLRTISTFKFTMKYRGFNIEDLNTYLDKSDEAAIDVICLFVTGETKIKLENVLREFMNKRSKTSYAFGNLFNTVINRQRPNDPENLNLICSQFVDTVLKLAKIDLSHKSSNIVIPQDFESYQLENPKLYKVYEGLAKEYNEKRVEDIIYIMMSQMDKKSLVYNENGSIYDLANHPFEDIKALF